MEEDYSSNQNREFYGFPEQFTGRTTDYQALHAVISLMAFPFNEEINIKLAN